MYKFRINILKSLILGLLASFSILVCTSMHLPAWVLFVGWSSQVMFCSRPKYILPTLLQETVGMFLGFLIVAISHIFDNVHYGLLVAVFSIVASLHWVSVLKRFNNLVAYFMGMIVWFGFQSNNLKDIPELFISLLMGFCIGLIFAFMSSKIETIITKD